MKVWVLSFVLISHFGFGQKHSEKEVREIFNEIIKTDKSHQKDSVKRAAIFVVNFERIQTLLTSGVIMSHDTTYSKRTVKLIKQGFTATHIHILQSAPEILLNQGKIDFYKDCLEKGQIAKTNLVLALRIFETDMELERTAPLSEELEKMLGYAKKQWQIEIN